MPKDAKKQPKISSAAESIRPEEMAEREEGELGDEELAIVAGGVKSAGPVIRTDPTIKTDPTGPVDPCLTKLQ